MRKLRYSVATEKIIAKCPHCEKEWSLEESVESYLKNNCKVIKDDIEYPDTKIKKLKTMALSYQHPKYQETVDKNIIDAAYNVHMHTNKSCFKDLKKA